MKYISPNRGNQIIPAYVKQQRIIPDEPYLRVAEFFTNTLQGEGIHTGKPCTFLRLQGCTLDCAWCDTKDIWEVGNPYTFNELFFLMEKAGVIENLRQGHHLVFTGGSPLLQQDSLIAFIQAFDLVYGFLPYVELENECTLMPLPAMEFLVNCWNNSPKLSHSGNGVRTRSYNIPVLRELSSYQNSWFKFVITDEKDWDEIETHYFLPKVIRKGQIILMPAGASLAELDRNRKWVAELAIKKGVRFSDRLHITLWDKTTGV